MWANAIGDFIAFEKLGIRLNISPVAFKLGPFEVHWYGIIIAVAILIVLTIALKQAPKFGVKEDDLVDMFLIALPISIVCARLFFVIFKLDLYRNDFWGIFRIWEGGVAIYGAIIGAILSVWIFSKKRKIDMWKIADFACVYLPLAQAIGRWGNFLNQELYGKFTDLPWGMTGSIIGSQPVHPTFLYESLWNILVFIVILQIRKRNKVRGGVFAWYIALYSVGRFLTELLRTDDFGVGSVRFNQLFAALVFITSFIFLAVSYRKKRLDEEPAGEQHSIYADVLRTLNEEEAQEEGRVETQAEVQVGAREEGQAEAQVGTQEEGQVEAQMGTQEEGQVEAQAEAQEDTQAEAREEARESQEQARDEAREEAQDEAQMSEPEEIDSNDTP